MENFRTLSETDQFHLGNLFEDIYLIEKQSDKKFYLGNTYGDPVCGIISDDNSFCVVGGAEGLIIWKNEEIVKIKNSYFLSIFDIKQTDKNSIKILVDPWSDNSSIWQLDIRTLEYIKVKDFPHYRDKEYTENIVW